MTQQTIVIRVDPTGDTTVQTKGFTGSECRQASRFLERTLGRIEVERLTPEFHLIQASEQLEPERE